ncbi:MAG: PEP-CTERM sorting domain-containing protein [Akkermansiaceae bacterium]|nr:PEP-CTERM sorting domain-containing protein [Akkermansiaceae bacterium]
MGNTGGFKLYNDALTPGGTKSSSALDNYTIPFTLTADTWTTMRIGFQEQTAGTTTISFYKDGALEGSTTSTELVGNLTEVRGRANVANTDAGSNWLMDNFTVTSVPEPSSAALLGLGGLTLILRRRRG